MMASTTIQMNVTKRIWFWPLAAVLSPILLVSKTQDRFYRLVIRYGIKIEVA